MPEFSLGIEVPLKEIDKNLTLLWQQAYEEKGDHAITRANTMNLIIISYEPWRLEALQKIIADVTLHHPSRVILLMIDPESNSHGVKAFVTTQCNISNSSQKQICYEQILLTTGYKGQPFLSGILLPLLLPDLPVFLWWAASDHQGVEYFDALRDFISHALFSSPSLFENRQTFEKYAGHLLWLNRFVPVADMNWAELTDWREAIAQFFDLPSHSTWLHNIDRIDIFQNSEQLSMKAMLLIGWLASRLRWKKQKDNFAGDENFFLDQNQKKVTIRFVIEPNSLSEISKLVISTLDDDADLELIVTRQSSKLDTIICKHKERSGSKSIPLSRTDEAELLCHELDLIRADQVFIEALSIWSIKNENP